MADIPAHIALDEVRVLFGESHGSWQGLQYALQQNTWSAHGTGHHLKDKLKKVTQDMETSGAKFPDSSQQLYEVINQKLGATSAH